MNILIAGASGFIGTLLVNHLSPKHTITILTRHVDKIKHYNVLEQNKVTWDALTDLDATAFDLIINLSGSNIGAKRWSTAVKEELIQSRTQTNQKLLAWLSKQNAKPRFFCANAVGIYGAQEHSKDAFDEDSPLPQSSTDFLQHIGLVWERSLQDAKETGIPVTILRFGVVLKKGEGMLKKLELPFGLGLGSILGAGTQELSWVHYEDVINAIDYLINHPEVHGSINITSPKPITQQLFAQQLAKTLKRPLFLTMPAFAVKLLFGEMGEYLLLKGQRVVPKRLTELGFHFTYPTIDEALTKEYID